MEFNPNHLYHVYNRGNRRIPIFYRPENYEYFLKKIAHHIAPFSDIIAYCLMPNHFHLMIRTNDDLIGQELNYSLGVMLRSYTRAINKQEQQVGSLFQSNTKAKVLNESFSYPLRCFNYIHLNPLKAGLVKHLAQWEYSSYLCYIGNKSSDLIHPEIAKELIDIDFD